MHKRDTYSTVIGVWQKNKFYGAPDLGIEYWPYIGMTLLVPKWAQMIVNVWMTMKCNKNETIATWSKIETHWTTVIGNIKNNTWEEKLRVTETTIRQHKHGTTACCCTWHTHEWCTPVIREMDAAAPSSLKLNVPWILSYET